jgi:hypothetical protein
MKEKIKTYLEINLKKKLLDYQNSAEKRCARNHLHENEVKGNKQEE